MDTALVAAAVVAAVVVGVFVGLVARGQVANQGVKSAQEKAARIVAEARAQQKEFILEAKDEKASTRPRGRGRGPRQTSGAGDAGDPAARP